MFPASHAQLMTSFLNGTNLATNDSVENGNVTRSVSGISDYVTVGAPSGDIISITYPSMLSANETTWLCDANRSELWQLTYPVCTTRFHSVVIFIIVAIVLTFITLWTVLGNILVLVALFKYRTLRTMSNCLIGNLAMSDLFLAITVLPISTTNDLLGYWVFGDIACTLWLCMDVLYCTASVWGLCTVAFDRYMATAYPVWYHDKRSVRKAVGCVVFVWIFSIIISFAPFIGWQHMIPNFFTFNKEINRYECILFMSSSYVIYSSVGSFIIPTCLMTFMYIRIFKVLHKQSKNMKKKIQARKLSRRRAAVANGCPTILVPDAEDTDAVVRDFTTTTLVSMSAAETSVFSEDRESEGLAFEQEHLLNVPRVSLHSPNGVSSIHRDVDSHVNENTSLLKDNDVPQNGNSLSVGKSESHNLSPLTTNTSSMTSKLTVPDISRTPQRRSNSMSAVSPNAPTASAINLSNILDLDRRNSHEGTIRPMGPTDVELVPRLDIPPILLKVVCNRSKSANILNSSDEDGSMHSVQQQRRSLPCDLTKLGRNNKMTMSMKRRFELREQRATKRMLLIMACFCVCWMPFVCMYITRSLCHDCYMNTHFVAAIIWLGYVNSSLNPVLYPLFNDDFKAAFKRLIGIKSPPPRRRR